MTHVTLRTVKSGFAKVCPALVTFCFLEMFYWIAWWDTSFKFTQWLSYHAIVSNNTHMIRSFPWWPVQHSSSQLTDNMQPICFLVAFRIATRDRWAIQGQNTPRQGWVRCLAMDKGRLGGKFTVTLGFKCPLKVPRETIWSIFPDYVSENLPDTEYWLSSCRPLGKTLILSIIQVWFMTRFQCSAHMCSPTMLYIWFLQLP